MRGDLQFIEDTFLLEKTFKILDEVVAQEADEAFVKKAQIGGIMGSIAQGVQSAASSQIDTSSGEGIARTVTNFLVPGIFFKLHPALGVIATAAQLVFGFSLYDVFAAIVRPLLSKLTSGQPVSSDEVNQAAASAMPGVATASDDLLYGLRELEDRGEITKTAQLFGRRSYRISRGGLLETMQNFFGGMGSQKGKSFIVGLLGWLLKRALLSVGLLAAGGAVMGLMGRQPGGQGQPAAQPAQGHPTPAPATPAGVQMPRSTGAGSIVMRLNPSDIWIEPLNGKPPHEVIKDWAIQSYPDLVQYRDIIDSVPMFRTAVQRVTRDWTRGKDVIEMPPEFKKKDDVLNMFVPYVFQQIGAR
jgi:hypothetical protein